ncbi:SpaA isopeptide-forming pilin-related protein, partial [Rhizobium ruizarguesonis]
GDRAAFGIGIDVHRPGAAHGVFLVSDIGVTTYAGTDGLNVFTRSLASAKPISGVELQLLAKNNEVLGTATTDENGRATFTAGLIRGTAALT